MPDLPDPPVVETSSRLYHNAANYAVGALVGSFIFSFLTSGLRSAAPTGSSAPLMISILGSVIMLTAIPAGVIALLGIRKYGRKQLLWKGLAGVLVPFVLTALAIPAFQSVRRHSEEKALIQSLAGSAAKLNEVAPKMVDKDTRLDKAQVGPAKTMTIRFTVVSLDAAQVDHALWDKNVVPAIRTGMENSAPFAMVKNGATVIYEYYGKDGKLIGQIVFRPEDYLAAKVSPSTGR